MYHIQFHLQWLRERIWSGRRGNTTHKNLNACPWVKIWRSSFLLKFSFVSWKSGFVSSQNDPFWYWLPSFEIMTHFMFSASLTPASSGCAVYTGSERTCSARLSLSGSQWNSSHMLWFGSSSGKVFCSSSVLQEDREGTAVSFWYNLHHFWKIANKSQIFQTSTAYSAPDTEYCGRYTDPTNGSWSPQGHLQITNMQQEITSIPGTVNLGEIISSYNWSLGVGEGRADSSVISSYRICKNRTGQGLMERGRNDRRTAALRAGLNFFRAQSTWKRSLDISYSQNNN